MKLTLKFSEGEMMDLQLLARWLGRPFEDTDSLASLVGILVRIELDKILPPKEGGEKP